MAIYPPPFDPNRQTPNGPFFFYETWSVAGPLGPLVLGSGLDVSLQGVLSSSGSGGSGTVTSVATGAGLIGGPITTTGTIALTATGVTPAAYTNANITVDAYGRITLAASGSPTGTAPISVTAGANPVISIAAASTTASGAVQLNDTVASTSTAFAATANAVKTAYDAAQSKVASVTGTTPISVTAGATPVVSIAAASTTAAGAVQLDNTTASTSTSLALTAAQGKNLQDQIDALAITSNLTLAGTLDTVTGNLVTVTTAGTTAGFAVGNPLPAAAAGNAEHFVIVTVAATSYTPPGGAATLTHVGDWFLSSGTAWDFLDVGFDPPAASTTTAGVVQLATNAQTQTGTDATLAVTPAGAAATYVACSTYAAKGTILGATGAGAPSALAVGTDGQVLYANSTCTTGLCWGTAGGASAATPTVAGIVLGCTTVSQTALGCNALVANTSGALNTAIGINALCTNTSGGGNTAIGANALCSNTVGCCNTAIGIQALLSNTTGCCNTATGNSALYFNISGCANTADGMFALVANTTGCCNTATGYQALCKNTTGGCNTATGSNALLNNTTGGCNVAVGVGALRANTTGFWTTATGFCALASNTTGNFNVANGACALFSNATGNCNIAVGFLALRATTGSANVAVGAQSGCGITSGSGNIAFGGVTSGGSYSPVFSATTENDRIVMGSNAVTNAYVQVAWTVTSDARDKTNVTALPVGLDFVNQLNPVSFQFKESRECDTAIGPVRYGFLAQEVLEAEGENPVIVDTEVPESLKITNDHFNAVLVKAIKELSAKINTLEDEIKGLKSNS